MTAAGRTETLHGIQPTGAPRPLGPEEMAQRALDSDAALHDLATSTEALTSVLRWALRLDSRRQAGRARCIALTRQLLAEAKQLIAQRDAALETSDALAAQLDAERNAHQVTVLQLEHARDRAAVFERALGDEQDARAAAARDLAIEQEKHDETSGQFRAALSESLRLQAVAARLSAENASVRTELALAVASYHELNRRMSRDLVVALNDRVRSRHVPPAATAFDVDEVTMIDVEPVTRMFPRGTRPDNETVVVDVELVP